MTFETLVLTWNSIKKCWANSHHLISVNGSISTLVVAGSWSKVHEIEALCVHVKITAFQKYSKAPKEVPFIRAAGSHWAPASRSMPSHSPCVARAGSQKLSQADKSSGRRSTCPKQKKQGHWGHWSIEAFQKGTKGIVMCVFMWLFGTSQTCRREQTRAYPWDVHSPTIFR